MWEKPHDEQTDTYIEVTEEPGYFDRALDAVSSIGEAAEHAARAGYHYASEQYHEHAARHALDQGNMHATDEHLNAATSSRLDRELEANAAREAIGLESVDYESEEAEIIPLAED